MLMPSALSCDSSQPPVTRLQSALFASPPASPPTTAQSAIGNIFTTCRALQSMLTPPAVNPSNGDSASLHQLPTPPMSHATLPPLKLRLRSRRADGTGDVTTRKKVVKRTAPPRGVNKRRRATDDEMGRDDDIDSDLDIGASDRSDDDEDSTPGRPSTPKRARIAPEQLPLGLERSDFHNLLSDANDTKDSQAQQAADEEAEVEADGEKWSTEDDRILVELVLEKLKLSKTDWQDCARSLGKDRSSIGRRWKSLVVNGDVGLRRNRRGRIHGTWR